MTPLSRTRLRWLGLVAGLVALAFSLGYRLPWFDRHPDWQEFPHLTNPHLMVAQVPDFARRYGHRFHLPEPVVYPSDGLWFDKYYQPNLRNVRTLGFQQTGNTFIVDLHLGFGNGTAPGRDSPATPALFFPTGYEYLEVSLAGKKAYCKQKVAERNTSLVDYYQYNYPAAPTDTLFLRYSGVDYYVTLR
jgi:hypothetical protein